MAERIDIVVIGAGPYGLATAAHLRQVGREVRIFGEPLHFWQTQTPIGMFLRSPYAGSNIGDPELKLTLPEYERTSSSDPIERPIPLERFLDYGRWFQERALPDVDRREVRRVSRSDRGFVVEVDGETFHADRVIVAAGVGTFAYRPSPYAALDSDLASHTLDHHDLSIFKGRRVAVIGAGQSALESAALLHEMGVDAEVLMRREQLRWVSADADTPTRQAVQGFLKPLLKPIIKPLIYSPFGVGPAFLSKLNARPATIAHVPAGLRGKIDRRSVRSAGSGWIQKRLGDVSIRTGINIVECTPSSDGVQLRASNGDQVTVDHVLLGTGYRLDLSKYAFLDADLVRSIACVGGYPQLSKTFETTAPGLHITGAPAAYTFGPLMRFVAGSGFASRSIARGLAP